MALILHALAIHFILGIAQHAYNIGKFDWVNNLILVIFWQFLIYLPLLPVLFSLFMQCFGFLYGQICMETHFLTCSIYSCFDPKCKFKSWRFSNELFKDWQFPKSQFPIVMKSQFYNTMWNYFLLCSNVLPRMQPYFAGWQCNSFGAL